MCLFEVNHLRSDKPLYEQGCILLPHLAGLGLGVRASGEIIDSYPFFVVGILHVISSAVLGFGGIFHAVLGPEILTTPFFAYRWQDKNQMTSILGIHLVLLGFGALLLVYKAVSLGGIYDTWAAFALGDIIADHKLELFNSCHLHLQLAIDGNLTRWHGTLGLVGFMLRQFEIARSIRLRPYNVRTWASLRPVQRPGYCTLACVCPLHPITTRGSGHQWHIHRALASDSRVMVRVVEAHARYPLGITYSSDCSGCTTPYLWWSSTSQCWRCQGYLPSRP